MKFLKFFLPIILVSFSLSGVAEAQTDFTYPANPDACVDIQPTFDWEYTGGSTVAENGYTLQVSTNLDFSDFVINQSGINSSSFTIETTLEYETVYYWRTVTEFTPSGTEISTSATFSTREAPPIATTPADVSYCMDLDDIIFSWSDISADYYYLEIATEETFGATEVYNSGTFTTGNSHTFTAGPLTKNTTYYWRVRGGFNSTCGSTEWSDIFEFRTEADPPVLTGPGDNDECVFTNAKFYWGAIDGIASYDLEFAVDPAFAEEDIVYTREAWASNTFTMPAGNLDPYEEYYWRVKGNFSETCSTDWSLDFHLKTSQQAPTIVYPQSNEQGVDLEPDLVWEAPEGYPVPEYDLQVATDAAFNNLLYNETGLTSASYSASFTLDDPGIVLTRNTDYYWRIRAQYGAPDNCLTDWTAATRFRTEYFQVTGTSPENGEECLPMVYDFQWGYVQDATRYTVQVSMNEDMSEPEVEIENIAENHKLIELANGMTDYYWRVRAEDNNNFGPWSSIWEFSTAHHSPGIIEPVDDSTGLPLEVTFVWEDIHEDALYSFVLNTSENFDEPLFSFVELESNTLTLEMPTYFDTYYWSVKGEANDCSSGWSDTVSFTTALEAPVLLIPQDYSVKQPLIGSFSWTASEGDGITYDFQLAEDMNFVNLVDDRLLIPENAYISNVKLDEETLYFWRVRAGNSGGKGPWSEIFRFTTGKEGPEVPVLVSPEDEIENLPTTVTLVWNTAERAETYNLRVATNRAFVSPVFELNEGDAFTDTTREITNLENFKLYYWQVSATSEDGTSAWSDIWTFRTAGALPEDAPNLIAPANNSTDIGVPVTFSWDATVNTQSYQLQVTTNSTTFTENDIVVDQNIQGSLTAKNISDLNTETQYYWRMRSLNNVGAGPWSDTWTFTTGSVSVQDELKLLYQVNAIPNPLNSATSINFTLPEAQHVIIKLYNSLGQEVAGLFDERAGQGAHSVKWDASGFQSGVYYYMIQIGDYQEMNQLILTK